MALDAKVRHPLTIRPFLSFNSRSLYNKLEELDSLLTDLSPPPAFICVQETWCIPSEPDSLYNLDGYLTFRRDRPNRLGGGVLIYVRAEAVADVTRQPNLETENEDLWLKLSFGQGHDLMLATMYRPPDQDVSQFILNVEQSVSSAKQMSSYCIITGDFNGKCQEWCTDDVTDDSGDQLQQLFCSYSLLQIVSFATHIHANRLNSCIDLVFTDLIDVNVSSLPPLGRSDHVVLKGIVDWQFSQLISKSKKRTVWCWSKVDNAALKRGVASEDWTDVLSTSDMDVAWGRWKDKLLSIAQKHVPRRTVYPRQSRPWVTEELKNAVKSKHHLFHCYKRTRSMSDWEEFRKQRNKVNFLTRKAKSQFVTRLGNETDNNNPGGHGTDPQLCKPSLYKLMRCLTKPKVTYFPDMVGENGALATTDRTKAELINEFFTRRAQKSAGDGDTESGVGSIPPDLATNSQLSNFTVDEHSVRKAFHGLNENKAPGGDGIPTRLLRLTAEEIALA